MTTHDSDHDFHQFRHFDRPASVSSSAAMRHRLDVQTRPPDLTVRSPALPIAHREAHSAKRRFSPRLSRPWQYAVAILAAILLISSLAIVQQPDEPLRLAFQPADIPSTEFNINGDAGQTGDLGPDTPAMGSFEQRGRIPTEQGGIWGPTLTSNIDSNSVFLADQRLDANLGANNVFFRYDLDTQQVVWERELHVPSTSVSDGARVYVVSGANRSDQPYGQLIALDIETGETAWEGPVVSNRFMNAAMLVISSGVVYVSDYGGNVVAVDSVDGSLIWHYPLQFREPTSDEVAMMGPQNMLPSVAVNDDSVYLVKPSRTIVRLDRNTGEELEVLPILDTYGPEVFGVRLMTTNGVVVAQLFRPERMIDQRTGRGPSPADILILDPSTLEVRYHESLSDIRGMPVLHENMLFVPAQDASERTIVQMMDVTTGEVVRTIHDIDVRWDTLLSISGDVLMATGDPSGIWFFDVNSGEQVGHVELGITTSEDPFEFPVMMWGDRATVITFLGEVYVTTNDLPIASPQATTPAA